MAGGTTDPFLAELQKQYLAGHPEAAFNYVFSDMLKNNPYGNWLRNQQSRLLGGYQGAVSGDVGLSLVDYLRGAAPQAASAANGQAARPGYQGFNLGQEFQNLAPSQRGENWSQFLPKIRYAYGPGMGA